MRYRCLVILPLLWLAGVALAQDAAVGAPPLKLALQPAPAATVQYRGSASVPNGRAEGRFKFKDAQPSEAMPQPRGIPGQPAWMEPAPVMGTGKMDANGRPPVDCQRTPMDRQCH